jgi:hypothetical protein
MSFDINEHPGHSCISRSDQSIPQMCDIVQNNRICTEMFEEVVIHCG